MIINRKNAPAAAPVIVAKTITQNGSYSAAADEADGYSPVTVSVPGVSHGILITALSATGQPAAVTVSYPSGLGTAQRICPAGIFGGNTALTSLTFSEGSVAQIAANAFDGCSGLTGTLVLPAPLVSIGSYAFRGCGMQTVDLVSPLLETISAGAFQNCSSLSRLIIRREDELIPLSNANVLASTALASGEIYVPDELVGSYKYATGWMNYSTRFRALSTLA